MTAIAAPTITKQHIAARLIDPAEACVCSPSPQELAQGAEAEQDSRTHQLREVLDGVDVVVRRRADEANAGRRVPGARDVALHLGARQLAALARLRALRDFDLQLVRVPAGDTAPHSRVSRCDGYDSCAGDKQSPPAQSGSRGATVKASGEAEAMESGVLRLQLEKRLKGLVSILEQDSDKPCTRARAEA